MNLWDAHGPVLPDALLQMRLGACLGAGSSREAYAYADDPSFVVKRSIEVPPTANMVEWSIWRCVRETRLAHTFGCIVAVSESGLYLLMERLDPITLEDLAATPNVPSWLRDVKPAAFGRARSGLIKVMDYGSVSYLVAPMVRRNWQRD